MPFRQNGSREVIEDRLGDNIEIDNVSVHETLVVAVCIRKMPEVKLLMGEHYMLCQYARWRG